MMMHRTRKLVRRLAAPAAALTACAALVAHAAAQGAMNAARATSGGVVVAGGLNGPQGVLVARDGSVWVVDSGLGGKGVLRFKGLEDGKTVTARYGDTARVWHVLGGRASLVASLPSINTGDETTGGGRLAILGGELYATSGTWSGEMGARPLPKMDALLRVHRGATASVANLWALEARLNPGGYGLDSHAYGLAAGPDGRLWIADAAGNDLLRFDPRTRSLTVVAAFGGVAYPAGAPLPPGMTGNPERGGKKEADPVPTSVAFDAAGNAYVSLLPGAPFAPGSGQVVRVTPRGVKSVFATGLNMATDIRRGPDGNFYVVQFAVAGPKGPTPMTGSLARIGMDGRVVPVLEKLNFPTSVDFNRAGDAYLTVGGAGAPGSGSVVMYKALARR